MPFIYDCCGCQVFHHSMENYFKFIKEVHENKISKVFNKVTNVIANIVSDVSDALPSLGFTEQEQVEKQNVEKHETKVCKVCNDCNVCTVCEDCYILHHNNKLHTRAQHFFDNDRMLYLRDREEMKFYLQKR